MNIVELLEKVGVDNTKVQFLHGCVSNVKNKKGYGVVSFDTELENSRALINEIAIGESNRVGIVVWFDRDKMPDELKEVR